MTDMVNYIRSQNEFAGYLDREMYVKLFKNVNAVDVFMGDQNWFTVASISWNDANKRDFHFNWSGAIVAYRDNFKSAFSSTRIGIAKNLDDFLSGRIESMPDKINYVNENKGDLT